MSLYESNFVYNLYYTKSMETRILHPSFGRRKASRDYIQGATRIGSSHRCDSGWCSWWCSCHRPGRSRGLWAAHTWSPTSKRQPGYSKPYPRVPGARTDAHARYEGCFGVIEPSRAIRMRFRLSKYFFQSRTMSSCRTCQPIFSAPIGKAPSLGSPEHTPGPRAGYG